MYIRRKVFSLLQDETGEERYFSTTEFDLDVEERVFAEKEKKGLSTGAKVGLGIAGAAGTTAAGILGAKYAGKQLIKKGNKLVEQAQKAAKDVRKFEMEEKGHIARQMRNADNPKIWDAERLAEIGAAQNAKKAEKLEKELKALSGKKIALGEKLSKPYDTIKSGWKKLKLDTKQNYRNYRAKKDPSTIYKNK